jgi:PTS system nitrogen regulatory IIA component
MHLSIDEVSRLLNLPEETVQRWVRQGKIPVYGFRDEYVFLEKDLRKWAASRGIVVTAQSREEVVRDPKQKSSLGSAMERGGVIHGIGGDDVSSVLRAAVEAAPIDPSIDRHELFARLIEREELSTTGIGGGVAIPHPRAPIQYVRTEGIITTCFVETPIDYGAIDGRPVFVLFLMLSPSPKVHLTLLAKLSHLLRDRSFVDFLKASPSAKSLLSKVEEMATRMDATTDSSKPVKAF